MAQRPIWSAVRLQPHRERLALAELTRAGYDVYCPRILHRRIARGRKIVTHPLLFPGYAFVAIVLQWYSAHYAPGVIGLLMDGERPARVPDAVIDELKSRGRNGIIALSKKPQLDPQAWLSVPPQSSDLADRCYRQSKKPALLPSGGRFAGPKHDDFRADWRAVVEIDDVLVRQADAAGRDVGANGPGFIGAVDAV
jgi:hypothetical protein